MSNVIDYTEAKHHKQLERTAEKALKDPIFAALVVPALRESSKGTSSQKSVSELFDEHFPDGPEAA